MKNKINSAEIQTDLQTHTLNEILFITSYPPRECGIATYSQDLIKSLNKKFNKSLSIKVCALESSKSNSNYPTEVIDTLNTSNVMDYEKVTATINKNKKLKLVIIQHEFGFFNKQEFAFLQFLSCISKPIILVFHTVLPHPNETLKLQVQSIVSMCKSIIVMTNNSAEILIQEYYIPQNKITIIAHGTHLVPHENKTILKKKYDLNNRKVLTTFGLLSSGKGIETTINSLPAIIKKIPEVLFLIIGKTHPEVLKEEGEQYRHMLEKKVKDLDLQHHVKFINSYLELPKLLDYLQLTDIYLFTSTDPNQAVSGTFAYAMSCACPIISTPIPHAREVLTKDAGIIFDFCNSEQLAQYIFRLLNDETLRQNISIYNLQKIVSTTWENSAVAHASLFENIAKEDIQLQYNLPEISLLHLLQLTTNFGCIQFSKINQPDIESGYTLDDNARALIALCMNYKETGNYKNISEIRKYLSFIKYCQQPSGNFLNYVDKNNLFTNQNYETNLDDSNGRAIWALGYLLSLNNILPQDLTFDANYIFKKSIRNVEKIHSTRAMAFIIKGIYFYNSTYKSNVNNELLIQFANRLVQMYKHESSIKWDWFESYLTYANSIIPEAILYAWLLTNNNTYKKIAISSLQFLLSHIFNENGIEVISNKDWLRKGNIAEHFGEQPIDVAYTIMTLSTFYDTLHDENYRTKMNIAFNWFLGQNRLKQIIYNPCTGGCYDGLEKTHVNLNQGAESTISYLMARLTIEKYQKSNISNSHQLVIQPDKILKKEIIQIKIAFNNLNMVSTHNFITNPFGITKIENTVILK